MQCAHASGVHRNCVHAGARNDCVNIDRTMPQARFKLDEHMRYALVQQSLVLIETELGMFTGGVIMGMLTAGCLGIWQSCEYCQVLFCDVVYMHDVLWQGCGGW